MSKIQSFNEFSPLLNWQINICHNDKVKNVWAELNGEEKWINYLILALALTIFSIGIAPYFSRNVRDMWNVVFHNKVVRYIDFPQRENENIIDYQARVISSVKSAGFKKLHFEQQNLKIDFFTEAS